MYFTPTQIEPLGTADMMIVWNDGEKFSVPYREIRYLCPCAGCVDEHSGQRTIQKSAINEAIRPVALKLVGRYALQITWSDGHDTGMFHFDRLREICKTHGSQAA